MDDLILLSTSISATDIAEMSLKTGKESAAELLKNIGTQKSIALLNEVGIQNFIELSLKVPPVQLIPIVRELTPEQSGIWIRSRGIGDIPRLIEAFGVQNLLVFLRTLGFEKNIHIMDVLGLEELVELAYTISGMKLPGLLALSGKNKKLLEVCVRIIPVWAVILPKNFSRKRKSPKRDRCLRKN